jgi:hypothetical protein
MHNAFCTTSAFLPNSYHNLSEFLDVTKCLTTHQCALRYRDVIVGFGIANEPTGIPENPLFTLFVISCDLPHGLALTCTGSYIEAHRLIRNITGVGAGNGPYISVQGGES